MSTTSNLDYEKLYKRFKKIFDFIDRDFCDPFNYIDKNDLIQKLLLKIYMQEINCEFPNDHALYRYDNNYMFKMCTNIYIMTIRSEKASMIRDSKYRDVLIKDHKANGEDAHKLYITKFRYDHIKNEKYKNTIEVFLKHPSVNDTYKELGVSINTIRNRFDKIKEEYSKSSFFAYED